MAVEFLIALFLLTALLAGVAGYALARRGAPKHSDLEALRRELEVAEQRAEEVQSNVTGHFEHSAMLFGQLARDYRAFLEHFSESAQALGISEVKARELLARADQPLLGQRDDVIDGETAAAPASAGAQSKAAPVSGMAADESSARATSDARNSGDELSAAGTLTRESLADEASVEAPAEQSLKPELAAGREPAGPDSAQAVLDADEQTVDAPGPDAAKNTKTANSAKAAKEAVATAAARVAEVAEHVAEPEPPLVNDVVESPEKRARVVDVEVDALGLPIEDADRKRAEAEGRSTGG